MTVASGFLWRFLEDVWDLLPTQDRELFETYWSGQIQIAANLEQKVIEAGLSTTVSQVPVFLTDRWNQFVMNEENCDLFSQVDGLTLTLLAPAFLDRETVFYDTLKVTSSSGQIQHEEDVVFFDGAPKRLRYGKIIAGTIAVTAGELEYTQNRDYAVNLVDGTIQALEAGRLPILTAVTVRYQHGSYTRDLDYMVNEADGTVTRMPSSAIPSGTTVAASYTYNATPTLPLAGEEGSVQSSILTDLHQDFSAVVPGRTLTILSGPNKGEYTVNGVPTSSSVSVVTQFPATQSGDVPYTLNAFPHGIKVSKNIVSIPHLQDLITAPTTAMVEGVDYVVRDGLLSARAAFPLAALGPTDLRVRQMWAETTKVDRETPYRNFGVLIDFYRTNSEAYKLALQGLWYTFWTGSTPGNLQRGLHILLGLPFAKRAGTVTRVDVDANQIAITDARGQIITYSIPSGLDPVVSVGDVADRFDSLTTGVEIIDRNNEPGFVANRLGRAGISRFLTSNATRGPGDTDETKALTLLENHLFLPQVLAEALVTRVNVTELVTFLDNMKPEWTEYRFSFLSAADETVYFHEELPANDFTIDLTTTVQNNQWNQSEAFNSFLIQDDTGQVIGGGTQATGNFRDLAVDYAALGVDEGDVVRITGGIFQGYHEVLKRVNTHTLSLDIPDALIQSALNLSYVVIPSERGLDNDAVKLLNEHIILSGTTFAAPSGLNTKTNADLAGLKMSNAHICALLLVDPGNAGNEIQDITDADKANNEIDVANPPGAGAQDHEIASCALIRVDNTGPTVTDVFAI